MSININMDRVRHLAYQIWEAEGQPHGQDKQHWDKAWKLVRAETLAQQQALLFTQTSLLQPLPVVREIPTH